MEKVHTERERVDVVSKLQREHAIVQQDFFLSFFSFYFSEQNVAVNLVWTVTDLRI